MSDVRLVRYRRVLCRGHSNPSSGCWQGTVRSGRQLCASTLLGYQMCYRLESPRQTAKRVFSLQFTGEVQVACVFYQREKPSIKPCSEVPLY